MQQPRYGEIISCGGWLRDMLLHNPRRRRGVIVGAAEELRCETEPFAERVAMQSSPEFEGDAPVYVSIDKDVLSKEYARTDWSQGSMTLPQLLDLLDLLRGTRWLGVDICGVLTEVKGPSPEDFAVNARTDAALFDKLDEIVKIKI